MGNQRDSLCMTLWEAEAEVLVYFRLLKLFPSMPSLAISQYLQYIDMLR